MEEDIPNSGNDMKVDAEKCWDQLRHPRETCLPEGGMQKKMRVEEVLFDTRSAFGYS